MIIVDCDNVIADDGWRLRAIDPALPLERRFDLYHELSKFDEPANRTLIDNQKVPVVMFTAMEERFRYIREAWLKKHDIKLAAIFMRPNGDRRGSVPLKREMLHRLCRQLVLKPSDIVAAYDDREDVIAMYKEEGANAIRVMVHENGYVAN